MVFSSKCVPNHERRRITNINYAAGSDLISDISFLVMVHFISDVYIVSQDRAYSLYIIVSFILNDLHHSIIPSRYDAS